MSGLEHAAAVVGLAAVATPVPEKRNNALLAKAARFGGFVRAQEFIGKAKLAARLGCTTRHLRYQASVERGVSDATLLAVAAMLEADAAEALSIAAQLRKSAAGQ